MGPRLPLADGFLGRGTNGLAACGRPAAELLLLLFALLCVRVLSLSLGFMQAIFVSLCLSVFIVLPEINKCIYVFVFYIYIGMYSYIVYYVCYLVFLLYIYIFYIFIFYM